MHAQSAIDAIAQSRALADNIARTYFVQSMVTAAATVAWADGWLHPAERSQLVRYVNRLAQTSTRRWKVLTLVDDKIRRLRRDPHQRVELLQESHVLAGTPRVWMVLRTAELVAAADGDVGEAEVAALAAIRCSLGISSGIRQRFAAACMLWGFAAHAEAGGAPVCGAPPVPPAATGQSVTLRGGQAESESETW